MVPLAATSAADEETLPGVMSTVVRVGDTVRRTPGSWTPAVHALLGHLRAHGFPEAPEPLGFDEDGREVLRFVPGQVVRASPDLTDIRLVAIPRLVRRYHEAVRSFVSPPGARWQHPGEGPILCHNDLAPRNVVFDGDSPVALLDWDFAAPGTPAWDLAHAAWECVPLRDDVQCAELGWDPLPDRPRRLRLFLDAYGLGRAGRQGFVGLIIRRGRAALEGIEEGARGGHPGLAALEQRGVPGQARREIAWIEQNHDALEAALS